MAKFLTTSEVSAQIERIIQEAKAKLFILSPFVSLGQILFERLKDAGKRNVKITLIYGKRELDKEQEGLLANLPGLDLHFYENLHAKCYFNEDLMVITSMNMYNFSEKTNREMGVLITRDQDEEVFKAAVEEVRSILSASETPERIKRSAAIQKSWEQIPPPNNDGFCIRCGNRINYNLTTPLCDECYRKWDQYQNPLYEENLCHKCGRPANTSKAKPLCSSCYQAVGGR